MIETIQEPIEVITVFSNGRIQPVRFRWRQRVVKVRSVTGDWVKEEGADRVHFFSILAASGDYFEISYRTRDLRWTLCRVWIEG